MTSANAPESNAPDRGAPQPAGIRPGTPGPRAPEQSAEDTDAGWGEAPEPGDDERFQRDRPPHWGSD